MRKRGRGTSRSSETLKSLRPQFLILIRLSNTITNHKYIPSYPATPISHTNVSPSYPLNIQQGLKLTYKSRSSLLQNFSLQTDPLGPPVPNYASTFLITNFVLAYLAVSPRILCRLSGFGSNTAPREDIAKYGEKAVSKGKITQVQLGRIKRLGAAHANAVENYPLLGIAVLFALHAGVENSKMNFWMAGYTVSRVVYAVAYTYIESDPLSYLRSLAWWGGNISCFSMIVAAGRKL